MEPLSQQTFDLWREGHDRNMDRILDYVEQQTALNLQFTADITAVKAAQAECSAGNSKRSAIISAAVTATLAGLAEAFKAFRG